MMPSCATVLVLGVLAMIPYLVMTSWFAARAPAVDVSPAGGAGADLDLGIYYDAIASARTLLDSIDRAPAAALRGTPPAHAPRAAPRAAAGLARAAGPAPAAPGPRDLVVGLAKEIDVKYLAVFAASLRAGRCRCARTGTAGARVTDGRAQACTRRTLTSRSSSTRPPSTRPSERSRRRIARSSSNTTRPRSSRRDSGASTRRRAARGRRRAAPLQTLVASVTDRPRFADGSGGLWRPRYPSYPRFRWPLIAGYLRARAADGYRGVLFADVRDTAFQADPFAAILDGRGPAFYARTRSPRFANGPRRRHDLSLGVPRRRVADHRRARLRIEIKYSIGLQCE